MNPLHARPRRLLPLAAILALGACGRSATTPAAPRTLTLTSAAFADGAPIPIAHTCDGADRSPPLAWSGAPAATRSLALLCDDPDAPSGTWLHWTLYNLAPQKRALPEAVPTQERLEDGACQGSNDFQKIGYGGPCPPAGAPHHYRFRLYALDTALSLAPGATRPELEKAMAGHTLAWGELTGRYQRRAP